MANKKELSLDGGKSKLSTQVRLAEIAEKIARSGWTKYDVLNFCREAYGLSETQGKRYFYSACKSMVPDDMDQWRSTIFSRNYEVLEQLLKTAIDRNDLKSAVDIVKAINAMAGFGGKAVSLNENNGDTERTITISFTD